MSHGYHAPGKQLVFSDDCPECDNRVYQGVHMFAHLDDETLRKFWTADPFQPQSNLDGRARNILVEAVLTAQRLGYKYDPEVPA